MGCSPHGTQGYGTHGWDVAPMDGTWHPWMHLGAHRWDVAPLPW